MMPIDEYLNSINSEYFYPTKEECDKYFIQTIPPYGRLIHCVDKADNYCDLPKFDEELPKTLNDMF